MAPFPFERPSAASSIAVGSLSAQPVATTSARSAPPASCFAFVICMVILKRGCPWWIARSIARGLVAGAAGRAPDAELGTGTVGGQLGQRELDDDREVVEAAQEVDGA